MKRWHFSRLLPFCAVLALTLGAVSLLAAQEAKNGQGTKPAAATKRLIVDGDHAFSKKVGTIQETTLTNAKITHEDSVFVAKTIVLQSEKDVHTFTCTGNPVFTDEQTRITGDKVVGQSTPRYAEFTGNVKMVATPKKKDGEGDLRGKLSGEPSTVTSNTLGYDYGKKLALAKGNIMVVQKNRTLWANEGTYDQNAELITLSGNVRMKNAGEEELKEMKNANTVTVSLQDDWIDIVAKEGEKVEFILDVKDE
jgi:lipopolysaccharide assembly outer membrane protein LptD (OstA)